MAKKLISLVLFCLLPLAYNVCAQGQVSYDITKYGAERDRNIARAIMRIWREVTVSTRPSKIVIPKGKWYLRQLKLEGPIKAPVELNVQGTLEAPRNYLAIRNKEQWITINCVNGFTVTGGGVFDGRGDEAWKQNDCNRNWKCPKLPLNLSFNNMNNSVIQDVTTKDSKNFHVNCIGCHNVTFVRFTISAPDDSPNTDGIHVARSSNVIVRDSVIQTGDDCVSIGDDSHEIHILNVTCGPGHGMSVGSLGKNAEEKDVSGIYIKNCTFINTENGVRVKTWPSAPATLKITNLQFENLIMKNVHTPIIIDQEYCPHNLCSKSSPSHIEISEVSAMNIRGTSQTPDAVILNCSRNNPCKNVVIGDIDLSLARARTIGKIQGKLIRSKCANVKPIFRGKQNPPICSPSTTIR